MALQHTYHTTGRMLLLLICFAFINEAQAQVRPIVAGASSVYNLPFGSLHSRYLGSIGGMVYAGAEVNDLWTWIGKFEYFELTTLNTDALKSNVIIKSTNEHLAIPLPKLTMKFTAASLTAEAMLSLLRSPGFESHAAVGFGFTNWVNTRGAYYDSLFATNSATGKMENVKNLAVPANRQTDWSGTINVGLDAAMKVADPIWLTAGVDYKVIVGELWQTLDLDIENVSGIQFISIRMGVRAQW